MCSMWCRLQTRLWFSANLHQHQKEHSGEKPFRRYKDRDLLVESSKVCLSEKPFTFGLCGKDVLDSNDLLQKPKADGSGKPRSSTKCKEALPHCSNHGQLPEVHSSQKPFKCSGCGKAFQKGSILLSHLRTNSEEIVRHPRIGNSLEEKSTLVNDQKFHTGETSHVCKECG